MNIIDGIANLRFTGHIITRKLDYATEELSKITNTFDHTTRSYGDACGTAHALDLVGDRWSLLVIRELMPGPKRFTDLRAGLPGLSANVLTQRLEKLEAVGVLRRVEPRPPAGRAYALTAWGGEAGEAISALGRWGARSPRHDPTLPLSSASLMMSMRTMFAPARARGLTMSVGLVVGNERLLASVSDGTFSIGRGGVEDGQVVLTGEAPAFAAWIYGAASLASLNGAIALCGDRNVANTFARLFELPPKAKG